MSRDMHMTPAPLYSRLANRALLDPYAVVLAQRFAVLLAICLYLAFATEGFATSGNLTNVLRQASLLFLIASGLTLVLIGGGLDLSIAANLTLSACLAAAAIKATGSSLAGLAAAAACGTLIGVANGLLVTVLRIPAFLATYGMLWIAQGLAYSFMGGQVIYGFPPALRFVGAGFFLGIPFPVWLMAAITVIGAALMRQSVFGREVVFMGASDAAARLSGIAVDRRRLALYTLSGSLAGLASIVYLGRVNAAEAGIGEPLLLPAIAAVLVGGTSLFGGSGGLLGTALGALILTAVINGLNLMNVSSAWHPFVTGAIILVAVTLDGIFARRER